MKPFPMLAFLGVALIGGLIAFGSWRYAPARHAGASELPCKGRLFGRPACLVDFESLRARRRVLDRQVIVVTGFLASDNGLLVVYSSELDYSLRRNDSSLGIRFPQNAQTALFKKYKYQYISIAAEFRQHERAADRIGRVGALFPPFDVRPIDVRAPDLQSENLLIDVDDIGR